MGRVPDRSEYAHDGVSKRGRIHSDLFLEDVRERTYKLHRNHRCILQPCCTFYVLAQRLSKDIESTAI
jgi:hypothetical protein